MQNTCLEIIVHYKIRLIGRLCFCVILVSLEVIVLHTGIILVLAIAVVDARGQVVKRSATRLDHEAWVRVPILTSKFD